MYFTEKEVAMGSEDIVLDLRQIEVIERLIDCVAKSGLINISKSDIQNFLKHGKKLILKSATINKATQTEVEKSGLLCDELHKAHKYLINIEAGANISLGDIDTIIGTFRSFEEHSFFTFSSTYDEYKTDKLKIDLFIMQ